MVFHCVAEQFLANFCNVVKLHPETVANSNFITEDTSAGDTAGALAMHVDDGDC